MPQPELVVISGDLVDTPTQEEYAHLQRLLAPLEIPLAAVPGNHDDRSLFRAAFPSQPYAQAKNALNFSLAVGPLDLVLINSSVPGAPHGSLDADTLGWLDATLANDSSRPALLFLHHPPFVTGIEHMDRQNLRNASELCGARATPSASATDCSRPRPSGYAGDVCRDRGDDLPGTQLCRRARSGGAASAFSPGRAAGVSSACLVWRCRVWRAGDPSRADRGFRGAIPLLRRRRQAAVKQRQRRSD